MDPDRHAPAIDHDGGAVTDVGVPESAGSLGLPTEPDFAACLIAHGDTVQAPLLIEAAHAARRDGIRLEPALRHEGAQDDGHRCGGVLLANVEQKLPLLLSELLTAPSVAARSRLQGVEATGLVGVMPPLERGERVGLAKLGSWRAKPLFAELEQGVRELAAIELAACQCSDDFAAKQRHRLGVVFRAEIFHWQWTPRTGPSWMCVGPRAVVDAFPRALEDTTRLGGGGDRARARPVTLMQRARLPRTPARRSCPSRAPASTGTRQPARLLHEAKRRRATAATR